MNARLVGSGILVSHSVQFTIHCCSVPIHWDASMASEGQYVGNILFLFVLWSLICKLHDE